MANKKQLKEKIRKEFEKNLGRIEKLTSGIGPSSETVRNQALAFLDSAIDKACEAAKEEERQRILKGLPNRIKNDDIEQFGCYNAEGNLRMQGGFNQCLNGIEQIINQNKK